MIRNSPFSMLMNQSTCPGLELASRTDDMNRTLKIQKTMDVTNAHPHKFRIVFFTIKYVLYNNYTGLKLGKSLIF